MKYRQGANNLSTNSARDNKNNFDNSEATVL